MSRSHCKACMGARGKFINHTCGLDDVALARAAEKTVVVGDDNANVYRIPKDLESRFTRLVWKLKNRPYDTSFTDWANELFETFEQYRI